MAYQAVNGGNMIIPLECTYEMPSQGNELWKEIEKCLIENDSNKLKEIISNHKFEAFWKPSGIPEKQTSLHKASKLGSISCMEVLIKDAKKNKVSIDIPDCNGLTPLCIAVKEIKFESVNVLLKEGAHINTRTPEGYSVLHIIALAIVKSKDDDLLKLLDVILGRNDIDLEAINKSQNTPLYFAANKISSVEDQIRKRNLISFCNKLVSKGAVINDSVKVVLETNNALTYASIQAPPQIPFISKFLNYLLRVSSKSEKRSKDEISDLIRMQIIEDKTKAEKAANTYIGSQSVLHYAIDCIDDLDVVKALIDAGSKFTEKEISGETCLQRCLSKGNPEILSLLIHKMKVTNPQLDFSYQTFTLLKDILKYKEEKHIKCLKQILNDKNIKLDLNQTSQDGLSILDFAASFNNQVALRLLLEKGAFIGAIGKKKGYILSALRPETLEKVMDGCIHEATSEDTNDTENIIDPKYTLLLDFGFLKPPTDGDPHKHNEVKTLLEISHNKTHRKALTHPNIQTFLYAKWWKVRILYYINLAIYFAFACIFTHYTYSLKDLRITEARAGTLNFTNATIEEEIQSKRTRVNIPLGFLIPFTLYLLLREVFQIVCTYRTYFKYFENGLELVLIIFVNILYFANIGVDATIHLAAWSIILTWCELVILFGRLPSAALHVTMLSHVSKNILMFISISGVLIVGFALSFNIILQPTRLTDEPNESFNNLLTTFPKVIVMSTGEFDYSDLISMFHSFQILYKVSAILIFLLFLFLIFFVLMNVMNGLAVTDSQKVIEEATLFSLKARLDLIYLIEEMMIVCPPLNKLLPSFHLIFGFHKPQLRVKINEPKESERINYGKDFDQCCSLDDHTADLLRAHRIQMLSKEE